MRNDHNNRQGYSKGYHVTKEGKKAKKGDKDYPTQKAIKASQA